MVEEKNDAGGGRHIQNDGKERDVDSLTREYRTEGKKQKEKNK